MSRRDSVLSFFECLLFVVFILLLLLFLLKKTLSVDSTDFCIRPISDESTEKNENGRLLIRHNKTIVEFSAKIASLKITNRYHIYENGRLLMRHNKTIAEFSAKTASLKINRYHIHDVNEFSKS